MARTWSVPGKVVAAVMAGVLANGAASGGIGLVGVAYAQAKPDAAKPEPAKPAAKPAAPAQGQAAPKAGATAPKAATPGVVDAKKAYTEGEKKFKAGDYANALVDFQTADNVKQTPQAARYIGLCYDNMGQFKDAVTAYERFLADVPPKMGEQGEEIKRRVEAIKAMPGKVHIESTPPGANVSVDGKALSAPTPTDTDLPPGSHQLHFTAESRVAQDKQIDVAFASKQDVTVELPEQPPPPPPPPPPVAAVPPPPPPAPPPEPKASSTVPALITGGLAVVAAGVGTVFGVMALGDKSDFDKNPTAPKADDGENHALIADMAFGVAITLGVTSAVLFLSNGSNAATASKSTAPAVAKKTQPLQVLPIVTPHGGGAGATWQF